MEAVVVRKAFCTTVSVGVNWIVGLDAGDFQLSVTAGSESMKYRRIDVKPV